MRISEWSSDVCSSDLLILDGAHNGDGARAAAATLDEGFAVEGARILVVGMLAGRDPVELLDHLGAADAALVVCCTPDSPRAMSGADLAAVAREHGAATRVVDDVGDAVRAGLDAADTADAVLVTGDRKSRRLNSSH